MENQGSCPLHLVFLDQDGAKKLGRTMKSGAKRNIYWDEVAKIEFYCQENGGGKCECDFVYHVDFGCP